MISVESLTKRYADAEAVSGITFHVEKGEILGLLGPNGAGKTTTMRILTCFVSPTSGTAKVAGYDIYDQSVEVRRNVGYLPESVPLYGEMRVDEYLRFRARLKGVPRSGVGSRLDYVTDRCGLKEVRGKVIDHLSKGYRQRVGLAEALVHNPPILILDEPTVGLDPNQIRQVRGLIQDLGREHTIILSSHILPEVEQVCRRVVIINKGRIVAQERTEVLRQDAGGAARIEVEMRGERPLVLEALSNLPGVLAVRETDGSQGSESGSFAPQAGGGQPGQEPRNGSEHQAIYELGSSGPSRDRGPADGAAGDHRRVDPEGGGGGVQVTLECAPGRDPREEIFRLAVARGWILLGLSRRRQSLEEIFINLTTREPASDAGPPGAPEGGHAEPTGSPIEAALGAQEPLGSRRDDS